MKKIKVALANEILELLREDSLIFNVNMNYLNNSIINYYLNNKVKKERCNMRKDGELQFFLHKGLVERYVRVLFLRKYKKEVDFIRDIFLEYMKLPIDKRNKIIKMYEVKK